MSRSGYSDEMDDQWALIRWRGAVTSAIRGKRGQAFLREMLDALDSMPVKALIAEDLQRDGQVCALGSVGVKRGLEMATVDPEDFDQVCARFGITEALAREIMWENDEACSYRNIDSDEKRWEYMRAWVLSHLSETGCHEKRWDYE